MAPVRADDIEAALRKDPALADDPRVSELARLVANALNQDAASTGTTRQIPIPPHLAELLKPLHKQSISFGTNGQFGDISFRDVVGGDNITIIVNMHQQTPIWLLPGLGLVVVLLMISGSIIGYLRLTAPSTPPTLRPTSPSTVSTPAVTEEAIHSRIAATPGGTESSYDLNNFDKWSVYFKTNGAEAIGQPKDGAYCANITNEGVNVWDIELGPEPVTIPSNTIKLIPIYSLVSKGESGGGNCGGRRRSP